MTNPTERPEERKTWVISPYPHPHTGEDDGGTNYLKPIEARTRIAALEAEVNELREENANARKAFEATLRDRDEGHRAHDEANYRRIKQMEEALREARKWCPECGGREYVTDPGPPTQQTRQFCPVCRFIRAALSPSDTEEEA